MANGTYRPKPAREDRAVAPGGNNVYLAIGLMPSLLVFNKINDSGAGVCAVPSFKINHARSVAITAGKY